MKCAALQMISSHDVHANLARAAELVRQAAQQGVELAVLPEYFCLMGQRDTDKLAWQEQHGQGPIQEALAGMARAAGIWLVGGTLPLATGDDAGRVFNSILAFDPHGDCVARYDKMHLFRFTRGQESYDESRVLRAGREPAAFTATDRAGQPWRVGLSICYDLRFPELYRSAEADIWVVPSAFTFTTGAAHWEVLLRARAIENQAWVIAAAQGGVHGNGRQTWGHSMVVDPWGRVLAQQAQGEAVVAAELDRARQAEVRAQLPALTHRVIGPGQGPAGGAWSPMAGTGTTAGRAAPAAHPRWRGLLPRGDLRRWLLPLLLTLVTAVLATLIWLASVYETTQVQDQVERNSAVAAQDIRQGLNRNLQSLQALQSQPMDETTWDFLAATLLYERRELIQVRWLDERFDLHAQAKSPYERLDVPTEARRLQVLLTCSLAAQSGVASYSPSYFVVGNNGEALGLEMIDVCQVIRHGAALMGYQVATYSLKGLLAELVAKPALRTHEVSFTDADGARLAVVNTPLRRSSRSFVAQQVIDLPGASLTLRMVFWHAAPALFPNVLTGLVTLLTIALVTVVSMLAKDMRRRQRAEQEVADALAFRNAMEDSLVTGLRARDLAGRISYVNPAFCEMVGFAAHELLGSDMPAPYWPPECVDQYRERQGRLLNGSDQLPPRTGYESLFMRKDGTRFPVLIFEAPLLDAKGQQTGWMSAVIDISEQRRIEEAARASQERLQATARLATVGEMASLISHEINQPLAAIASYATGSLNLLRQGPEPGAAAAPQTLALRSAVQQIAAQAERAGKVITSVRDFVQRRHQAHERVQPHQLQHALEPLLRLQARKLGVTLVWHIEPGLPPLLCDRIMIEQVLLNLARNGMQAMEQTAAPQRRLLIQVERWQPRDDAADARQWLRFSVADQGVGIGPELGQRLFSRFFSTKPEGMGLGLSLCRTVVEQHGGQLVFGPNAPCGTIFRFTLPLAPAPEAATPATPGPVHTVVSP